MGKSYIDSAYLQELWSNIALLRLLLHLRDLCSVIYDLSSCGNQRHERSELHAEVIDASPINLEEEICLGLFWKTRPVMISLSS